jgi:regulator of sigma D
MIERWIEERRELLVKYCELTEVTDFSDPENNYDTELQQFCEIMVDYVSVGHFEVFEQITKEAEIFGNDQGLDKSPELIDKIQTTTELILDFNDKYITAKDLDALIIDLAALGETFVQRFADEDVLIDLLHSTNVSKLIGETEPNSM